MDRAAENSLDAFARARVPELLRLGYTLTGDMALAEDLVQEALVRLAASWRRVRKVDDYEGYVRVTMVRLSVSWWRRRRREILSPAPRESAERDETWLGDDAARAWSALAALPPRQRAVLTLRYRDDLDNQQIATLLGCSVGTVKSQASRALATMRATVNAGTDTTTGTR